MRPARSPGLEGPGRGPERPGGLGWGPGRGWRQARAGVDGAGGRLGWGSGARGGRGALGAGGAVEPAKRGWGGVSRPVGAGPGRGRGGGGASAPPGTRLRAAESRRRRRCSPCVCEVSDRGARYRGAGQTDTPRGRRASGQPAPPATCARAARRSALCRVREGRHGRGAGGTGGAKHRRVIIGPQRGPWPFFAEVPLAPSFLRRAAVYLPALHVQPQERCLATPGPGVPLPARQWEIRTERV